MPIPATSLSLAALPNRLLSSCRPISVAPPNPVPLSPLPITPASLLVAPSSDSCRPIPDDTVPDAALPQVLVERRATELYPTSSLVLPQPTLRGQFTQAVQRRFKAVLNAKDPRIVAKLEQPFGKENLHQSFVSEASLRHILLPLWKSGFLVGDTATWTAFAAAFYFVKVFQELLDDHADVPFMAICGYNPDWASETVVNQARVRMATAALLHFNGSMADLVRFIGGPHVGEHHTILLPLRPWRRQASIPL